MFSSEQDSSKPVKYGELIVLGCNGSLPGGDRGRRRSRFGLFKRPTANGVKPSTTHTCSPQAAKVISNTSQHSVSYTLSWAETVVVEYTDDNETDMFQIGRSTESPIDIVVTNTASGSHGNGPVRLLQSTISRFACRIVCDRTPPYTARVYAAGFDCSRNIFLGEKAAKWRTFGGQMDGLTTNGVLLMQPARGSRPAVWREISVCGNVFTLRDSASPQNRGKQVKDEAPVLLDGSLIDLCGVTLLWRSVDGLSHSPTASHLEALRLRLNAARPQCPVLLSTLAFPSLDGPRPRRPWAYLTCGHVHGYHPWQGRGVVFKQQSSAEAEKREEEGDGRRDTGEIEGRMEEIENEGEAITGERDGESGEKGDDTVKRGREKEGGGDEGHREIEREREKERPVEGMEEDREAIKGERECPLCRSRGPYVPLTLGRVSGVYADAEAPSHAFVPCGHVCSERTVEHWSKTPLKRGTHSFHPACPFCLGQLRRDRPYVRLIFQGPLD
ncbi:E3 ubiquitin-protein ligase pellino homolog 1 [Salminus brasiliensis]|uniref:E3 ubiquitin-protein ligase pellino homolog 1 n=1 Tax=Salminus brasiliensis TaxID=930266 RepID=UPI003B8332CE